MQHNNPISIAEEVKRKNKIANKKDFTDITNMYKFFKDNSNEYEANKSEIMSKLKQDNLLKQGISILDFGGGDGEFLRDLYVGTDLNKLNPILYLYEPVKSYQMSAKSKLLTAGYQSPTVLERIDTFPAASLDLILVSHVLYYVENLSETISQLRSKLNENGQLWILMADDEDNSLIKLWEEFFKKLNIELPYFLTKDLRFILQDEAVKFSEKKSIQSGFNFKNTPENRKSMTCFLLGGHSKKIHDDTIKEAISCYQKDDKIHLPLSDSLFTIKK